MKKANNIFEQTDCISDEMLTKYVSDKLSPAEKHGVEKHLIDCEMCSDAVEGMKMIRDNNRMSKITAELNQKVQSRVERKEPKIIFFQHYRTQFAVAASVAVLLGLVWFFRSNMSMKELDPATSEKIFADKFEPYKGEAEEKNDVPAAESPAAPALQAEPDAPAESKASDRRSENENAEDKKVAGKETTVAAQLSKEGAKNEEGLYQTTVAEKKTAAAPVTSTPQNDAAVRDEEVLAEKKENAPKQAVPQKPAFGNAAVTSTTSGATDNLKKDKEKVNRDLKEAEKNQQVELLALESKSNSGKDRAKSKKNAKEAQTKVASEEQSAMPQEVAEKMVLTDASTQTVRADSVSAGSISVGDDANVAMRKYEQKDYSGAAMDFETVLKNDPDNYNALFYSAVSYLSTGETDKAITNLNKVLEKKDGEFYDAAQWYLSLAYIKKNDTPNARKNLTELQKNSKSRYQKQADETLKEMQK